MKVICISGHAGHGKDATATIMRKALWGDGHKVLIIHFADLLKFVCKTFFSWNGDKDEYGRSLLQHVGTELIRSYDQDYWVHFISQMLIMLGDRWDYVIIPDTRFPNEIQHLVDTGFDVIHIRVTRPGMESSLTSDQQSHSSETSMDDIAPDYHINNCGNLVNLTREVLNIIPFIKSEEVHKR